MNQRRAAHVLVAATAVLVACGGAEAPRRRPNVVVIMTDDQRWDELAYMPIAMERLVGDGVTFTESFVTTSLCCPSRASFLSGKYAHHHGIITLGGATRFDASSTIAVWLQRAGYRTALIGKYMNNNGILAPRIPPGWNTWRTFADTLKSFSGRWLYYDYDLNEDGRLVHYGDRPEDYSTDVLGQMALDFVRAEAPGPFLLVYTPFAPHTPPTPANRHKGAYADLELKIPASYFEADVTDKPQHVRDHPGPGGDDWEPERKAELLAKVRQKRIPMLESLLAVDEWIGRLLDALVELGIDDDTVVLLTSDNGFMWGEHWKLAKLWGYEESIRVPLVVRDPRDPRRPREEAALALNIDLAPTIAALAGVEPPPDVDGRSLLGVLAGSEEAWRDDFLIELPPDDDHYAFVGVRTARWKYIVELGESRFEELYDLASDPLEMDNLLVTNPEDPEVQRTAAHLRVRAAQLSERTDLSPPVPPR